jgi:hypothetical protein
MYNVVIDPKTGRSRTESAPDKAEIEKNLAEKRKELRDMLDGNIPFHDDPYSTHQEEETNEQTPSIPS